MNLDLTETNIFSVNNNTYKITIRINHQILKEKLMNL